MTKAGLTDQRVVVRAAALKCTSELDAAGYEAVEALVAPIMKDEKSSNRLLANAVAGVRFTNDVALAVIKKALESDGVDFTRACLVSGEVGAGTAVLPESLIPVIDEGLEEKKRKRQLQLLFRRFTGDAVFERLFRKGQSIASHPDKNSVREFLKKKMADGTADQKRRAKNILGWLR